MTHNRIQPLLQYGCVALRMRFFSQNFGTIKRILPGSSSPSHREGPGTEVAPPQESRFRLYITRQGTEHEKARTSCNVKNSVLPRWRSAATILISRPNVRIE